MQLCFGGRFVSGQILHPVEAVDLDDGDKALEDLVAFEAGKDDPCRCAKQRGDDRRGQNDQEDKDGIHLKDKVDIAARFDKSEKTRSLIAGADHRDREDGDKLSGVVDCFGADTGIKGDEGVL